MGERWSHVQGVAETAGRWVIDGKAPESVVSAAWLHDIGYSSKTGESGMHAIDGAAYLDFLRAPPQVVSLVAHHTGAQFEAEERGLLYRLRKFRFPDPEALDLLTLADLTTNPKGNPVSVKDRLDEILLRYEPQHPVHRATVRARPYLEECCHRAAVKVDHPT